ncbi:MAG TPA: choice-of-anchor Q domain-containing protein [Kofleriaceae bacterium]
MVTRVLIALASLVSFVGACEKQSKLYCEMHPGDLDNCGYLDAGIDARPVCMTDQECTGLAGAPYCEPNAKFCVECYLPEHCSAVPGKPFCDPSTFLCTSCVKNLDCPSNVCLPNGVCGDDSNVAYVDPTAPMTNTQCTMAAKCKLIEDALLTKRPYIKLQGAISEVVAINSQSVTLIGEPGTTLTRPSNGVVMTVTGGADVSIFDLTIVGAAEKGVSADMNSTVRLTRVAVTSCNGKDHRAIEVKNSTLIMTRSSVFANVGGGINVDAGSIFQITNSFVFRNGSDTSMVGGLQLLPTSSTFNRFEFNTVVDNRATATAAGGINCQTNIPAPNNLIARNYAGGHANLPTDNTSLSACDFTQSIKAMDVADYAFVTPDGIGPWDYHVGAGSLAIDRGVTTDINIDVDGDARPQGTKVDVGADEFKL